MFLRYMIPDTFKNAILQKKFYIIALFTDFKLYLCMSFEILRTFANSF